MSFNRLSKGFRGLLGIIKLGSYFFKVKKKNLSIFLRRLCSNCYTGFQVISLPCKSGWCPNNTSEKLGTGKPTAASSDLGCTGVENVGSPKETKREARTLDAGATNAFLLVLPWLCFPVKQERSVQREIFKRDRGSQWTQTWKENIIEKEKLARSLFPAEWFHKEASRLPLDSLLFSTCFWARRAWFAKQQCTKVCAVHLTCKPGCWKCQNFTVIEHITEPCCCTPTFQCSPGQRSRYIFASVY